MPASFWDMSNWYNWYWWPLNSKDDQTVEEELETKNEIKSQLNEIIETKEEIIRIGKESPDKPKKKRKIISKNQIADSEKSIQLVLRPDILEELEKEAIVSDSTLNQLIQVVLEAHIESKDSLQIQSELWHCSFCDPQEEFSDYFKFSEHFFAEHMQPGLEKLSEINKS